MERQIHVPNVLTLTFYPPSFLQGIAPGKVLGDYLANVDIAPTIAELAGVLHIVFRLGETFLRKMKNPDEVAERPSLLFHGRCFISGTKPPPEAKVDGRSMVPLVRPSSGDDFQPRTDLFFEFYAGGNPTST